MNEPSSNKGCNYGRAKGLLEGDAGPPKTPYLADIFRDSDVFPINCPPLGNKNERLIIVQEPFHRRETLELCLLVGSEEDIRSNSRSLG